MGSVTAEETSFGYLLANQDVMLRINRLDHPFLEEYFVRDAGGAWHKILEGGNCGEEGSSVVARMDSMVASIVPEKVEIVQETQDQASLEIDFSVDSIHIRERITLGTEEDFFTFRVRVTQGRSVGPQYIVNLFAFRPGDAISGEVDFTWTPALCPEADDVVADHAMRSPAVVVHKEPATAVLIPDVRLIGPDRRIKTSADLNLNQQEAPVLSYGLRNWVLREHTFYRHGRTLTVPASSQPIEYGLILYLTCRWHKEEILTEVSSFLWRQIAAPKRSSFPGDDPAVIESRCEESWHKGATSLWIDIPGDGERLGGIRTNRLHWANNVENDGDVWFGCSAESVHTALGLYLYGRRLKNDDYTQKALATVNLALAAPQQEGIFPSIAYKEKGSGRLSWIRDSGWAGHSDLYHAMDCSWTAYWLLQFAQAAPELKERIIGFCRPYAAFLAARQKEDGLIPSWYDGTLSPLEDFLFDVNAETGTSALFLAALSIATGDEGYRACAGRALEFMSHRVLPTGCWFDHETFYSCSDKDFDFFDFHTKQPPQGTLSMIHTGMAYHELYKGRRNETLLEDGIRVLSLLGMYQQVWSPPFFSIPTMGGFGVQNTDAEWSDARQAFCAGLFYDYFALTGNDEYRQRAVWAILAALRTAPAENWAHDTSDSGGPEDCFHWGEGSAAAAAEILSARHGNLFIP